MCAGGDHACLVFASEDERREQVAAFLRGGFAAGDRILYLLDADELDARALGRAAAGLEVAAELASGQLDVRTTTASYLAGGRFDPAAMLATLGDEVARARADGWAGLRVTGEMTWALSGAPGCERLLEYEHDVGPVLAETGALGICQYDARRFDAGTVERARALHTVVLRHTRPPSRSRLSIERRGPGALAVAGEVDFGTAPRLAASLDGEVACGGDVTLAAESLTFVDVAGVRVLCTAAARLAERGRRLVVLDPPRAVERAVDLVTAAGMVPRDGLVLRASEPPA